MAEDSDLDKTEPASPRRLERAREEGQVARSRELSTLLLLATGLAVLWMGAGHLHQSLTGIMRSALWLEPGMSADAALMLERGETSVLDACLALAPFFLALLVATLLAPAMLGGLLFSFKTLRPKLERLNPVKGMGRIFSAQAMMELLKTLSKVLVIGGLGAWGIGRCVDQMLVLMYAGQNEALAAAMLLAAWCCALIVAALVLPVLIDVPWQLFSHRRKLRMSHRDVRQENKESEGDPLIKGRLRQQQRALARRRMMEQVPGADVIVTNPTHYAVALAYHEGEGAAPRVVAKGAGIVAERIRQAGALHRIPVLNAAPLARALYHHVELGQEIPATLYAAVAEVLAWVYQLRRWERGEAGEPRSPEALHVPAELDPAQASAAADHLTQGG